MSPVKKSALWVLLAVLSLAAGYLGYSMYLGYLDYKAAQAEQAAREQVYQLNRTTLIDVLSREGVRTDELVRGFWYAYADGSGESVGKFDLDEWARRQGLTQAEIEALAARVKDAYRVDSSAMRDVLEGELPPELRFHNTLYNMQPHGAFGRTLDSLTAAFEARTASAEDLWRLAYMLEMRGEYQARDGVYDALCERYDERCESGVQVSVRGRVVDMEGRPIQAARVSLLSNPSVASVTTGADGSFVLNTRAREMEKLRLSAVKRNYSSGVASAIVVSAGRQSFSVGDIILGAPIDIITIDTGARTVTDPESEARPDGSFVLKAEYSTYEIPADAIVDSAGRPYRGVVDVYIYEFTRDTVPQNLIAIDTFDEVIGYAGNLMLSYGMPFIQFFAENGTQLDVRAERPMLLTYRIPSMQLMFDNADDLAGGPVTEEQIQHMLRASASGGFPITAKYLFDAKISSYPPFWVLNRRSGVWDNMGVRLIGDGRVIQSPFYTWK